MNEKKEQSYYYNSPIGRIILEGNEGTLLGLWFESSRNYKGRGPIETSAPPLPFFVETSRWLDIYFSGKAPGFIPRMEIQGSAFMKSVCQIMLEIPFGQTTTYGAIAKEICHRMNKQRMSAQAVGGAVGHNPISLIIPCHRVIGSDGKLTGYGGGIDKKQWLLNMEHNHVMLP